MRDGGRLLRGSRVRGHGLCRFDDGVDSPDSPKHPVLVSPVIRGQLSDGVQRDGGAAEHEEDAAHQRHAHGGALLRRLRGRGRLHLSQPATTATSKEVHRRSARFTHLSREQQIIKVVSRCGVTHSRDQSPVFFVVVALVSPCHRRLYVPVGRYGTVALG